MTKLCLNLTEDHGGLAADDVRESSVAAKQADLGQLVSSLNLTAGAPPFLKNLLSSLQHFQSASGSSHTTPTHPAARTTGEGGGAPIEITEMMAAFRQLRPPPLEHPQAPPPPDNSSENKDDSCENEEITNSEEKRDLTAVSLSSIEAMIDRKIAYLEARLKDYIDSQVKAAMTHFETKFEQNETKENRMMMRLRENTDSSQHGTQNGLLNFEDQLD